MSQRSVRQGDIAKAIKAASGAGLTIAKVEIDPQTGRIIVIAGKPEPHTEDPYETWRRRRDARSA